MLAWNDLDGANRSDLSYLMGANLIEGGYRTERGKDHFDDFDYLDVWLTPLGVERALLLDQSDTGPPAPAEDRTAYIPAKDVIADDEYVSGYKDLHRILKEHPWIRTYRPSKRRFAVHAGDWNRYKRDRDLALDSPAVDPLIEAAKGRKDEIDKMRKSHFPSISQSEP